MNIRKADTSDLPAMSSMIARLFSIESDFAIDRAKQERGLRALLDSEHAAVFVAFEDSPANAIGMVTVQLTISTAEGGFSALIEDLFVGEAFRGRGLATALIHAAEDWCRSRGASRVQLLADYTNEGALKFYDHMGFAETKMRMRRRYLD